MTINTHESLPDLSYHFQLLGRIYACIGWLGMLGSLCLFLAVFSNSSGDGVASSSLQGSHMPQIIQAVLLAIWSVLLLNFSKDIAGSRKWSTGIGGCCFGALNLISAPIGTAIGTYTLWILFQHARRQSRQATGSKLQTS